MAFKSTMLFDVLGNILTKKSVEIYKQHINDEHFKDATKFMIIKYLSMSSNYQVRQIVLDNYLTLERMPEKALYKWLLMNIPKQNNSFIRYIR
jgi:hypothetical protein